MDGCVCALRVTILPLYFPTRFGDCSRGVIFLCFPLFVKSQNQCFHETKRRVPKYVDIFEWTNIHGTNYNNITNTIVNKTRE